MGEVACEMCGGWGRLHRSDGTYSCPACAGTGVEGRSEEATRPRAPTAGSKPVVSGTEAEESAREEISDMERRPEPGAAARAAAEKLCLPSGKEHVAPAIIQEAIDAEVEEYKKTLRMNPLTVPAVLVAEDYEGFMEAKDKQIADLERRVAVAREMIESNAKVLQLLNETFDELNGGPKEETGG